MDRILKMLKEQKITIFLGVELNGKLFHLNTIEIKGDQLYIAPPGKFSKPFSGYLKTGNNIENVSIPYSQLPPPENIDKSSPRSFHISVHRYKIINTKGNNASGTSDVLPRAYVDLLNEKGITDFYLFIPKNPFKKELQKRHLNKNCHILKLPADFNPDILAIEYKVGIAPKNVNKDAVSKYQRLNPGGTKVNLPLFDLYLSFRLIQTDRKGLHLTIYRRVLPDRIITK